jgi:hypothetical protein
MSTNGSDDLAEVLTRAGLPLDNIATRQAALPGPLRDLHRRVLTSFAGTGAPPTPTELIGWAAEHGLDLHEALRELSRTELVFTNPDASAVTGAVPFAAGASAHRVRIARGPDVFGNCAVDALGIAAMLDQDVDVRSTDPHTGEPVTAVSRAGVWSWQPGSAVVFVGSSGPGRLTDSCCPVINFFTSAEHAEAYRATHGLSGVMLTLPDAARAGALVFVDLLREPTTASRTPQQSDAPAVTADEP